MEFVKTYLEFINEQVLIGGKGDDTDESTIDKNELEVGIAVEAEHSSDKSTAKEVAIDHLTENPKYYSELVKSGIVDEPDALKLAKDLLGIDMTK